MQNAAGPDPRHPFSEISLCPVFPGEGEQVHSDIARTTRAKQYQEQGFNNLSNEARNNRILFGRNE